MKHCVCKRRRLQVALDGEDTSPWWGLSLPLPSVDAARFLHVYPPCIFLQDENLGYKTGRVAPPSRQVDFPAIRDKIVVPSSDKRADAMFTGWKSRHSRDAPKGAPASAPAALFPPLQFFEMPAAGPRVRVDIGTDEQGNAVDATLNVDPGSHMSLGLLEKNAGQVSVYPILFIASRRNRRYHEHFHMLYCHVLIRIVRTKRPR